MYSLTPEDISAFRRKIWRFYRQNGRDLPFRNIDDPYRVTVSELMLQQTQVSRMLPKYEAWVARWPDWTALAKADNRKLLAMWSGLGYNRRALFLGRIALTVVELYDGRLPETPETLMTLPGIGPYTARAILIFAFNRGLAAVDTNIRRVILSEFDLSSSIPPGELDQIAQRLLPRGRAREWHYALMDYSSLALPKRIPSVPPISKQSPFEGSLRQIRGEIIRRLTHSSRVSVREVAKSLGRKRLEVRLAVESLEKDGMIESDSDYLKLK